MTDLVQGQAEGTLAGQQAVADSGRAAARAVLGAALSGMHLTATDRRFVTRLTQWDKRTATMVASLISRARQRGRNEGSLGDERLGTVLAALRDAIEYRTSGAASAGCWDCASLASGLCAEHAKDTDRARQFQELAARLGDGDAVTEVTHGALMLPELSR